MMKISQIYYSVILQFLSFTALSQSNLVPNPGFDTYTTCPLFFDAIGLTGNWYTPTNATSDLFHSCAITTAMDESAGVWVPANACGYQTGYNNSAGYAGIIAYEDIFPIGQEWKEYIQTPLNTTLAAGQKYYCSFYVSLADKSCFATDVIGAYFSQTAITLTTTAHFTVSPQIASPTNNFLTDDSNWTQVAGSFIASGGEQFITIGDFNSRINTSSIIVKPESYLRYAYYYLDEVCVSTSSVTCKIPVGLSINNQAYNDNYFYYSSDLKKIVFLEARENLQITITDIGGRQLRPGSQAQNEEIDLSDLEKGCYLVYVTDSDRSYVRKIFVD